MKTNFKALAILLFAILSTSNVLVYSQEKAPDQKTTFSHETDSSAFVSGDYHSDETKSAFSFEVDPIVPLVLHGISGHFLWKPKSSKHFVFGLAIIALGKMPKNLIDANPKNKNQGWHYKINQGFGVEGEYYFKKANYNWFVGLQLLTNEINLTNDNVPEVTEHRTNIGMAVINAGYKWYPFKKQHLYLKPWAGIGYTDIMKGAFSSEVIPNTTVGSYTYNIRKITPFATVHIGYRF